MYRAYVLSSAPILRVLYTLTLMTNIMLCLFPRSWSYTTGDSAPVSPDHLPTYNGGGIACPSLIDLRAVPKIAQVPASKQTDQKCGQFAA